MANEPTPPMTAALEKDPPPPRYQHPLPADSDSGILNIWERLLSAALADTHYTVYPFIHELSLFISMVWYWTGAQLGQHATTHILPSIIALLPLPGTMVFQRSGCLKPG
jgi:hypothetical protein